MTPKRNFLSDGLLRHGARLACAALLGVATAAGAQGPTARPVARAPAEQGVKWSELRPAQQAALRPLEQEWSGIEGRRKQKWLELAARFPDMSPDERTRIQTRMTDWARLTPAERGAARLNYQEMREIPLQDREARWKAYQALTPEQRQELAARAGAGSPRSPSSTRTAAELNSPPRTVAPAVVQAGPGATTTLITRRPSPPGHQQTGMPKIAATPEFVNKATLLPRRGPQGAATRSAVAPVPDAPTHP